MKLEALALEETVIVEDALYPILRQLIANKTRDLESLKNYLSTEDAATINTNSISILLQIHPEHPAVRLLNPLMVPASQDPEFRYYVRIVDYPQFIRTVTPELERRLECSPMAGTTGRLRLDFYRKVEGNVAKGLEIIIEKGKIVEAQHWTNLGYQANAEEYLAWKEQGKVPVIYTAAFAPLTFNTLLLGERSLNDLMWSYGETLVKNEESKLLLNALFPKVSQHIDTVYY
ncbi:hypothetical protein BGZ65_002305 [Modicella reniformis]|uniref:Uncharacterized protein n=1 Tax=Modicella reniformis TaxID=1440133 RepID=A0A9P6M9M4_9FUNG|nr:hypothetical protein BGZ65_002305 [Modicella reniformis]